ncbi:hypothetical protein HMPREF1584_01502 [Gardnerella vaginalis JCP8481A]|nr:hypothetical protein HMPREF1584_01502 [Gardnerella vaginalis JCP8481A]EPI41273.1 hypothetical protein HMPREF1585_01261 [Gardnerella vaginalis JCP8481B]
MCGFCLRQKNKKTSVIFANTSVFCRTRPICRYLRPILRNKRR